MESTKELRKLAYYAETGRCAARVVELLLGNICNDYPINCCDACREDADAAINALADRIEREHEEAIDALGAPAKHQKPSVIGADGLPIEVGQKVYDEHCSAHIVSEIDAARQTVEFEGEPKGGWVAACLTHACSDTQERIDKDVVAFANECARYAGQASSNDWFEVEIGKLLRRQRELCEREAERG